MPPPAFVPPLESAPVMRPSLSIPAHPAVASVTATSNPIVGRRMEASSVAKSSVPPVSTAGRLRSDVARGLVPGARVC
jgi:hypothetical protein